MDEETPLVDHDREYHPVSPEKVSLVAHKLRYLVEQTIPCALKTSHVTRPHSHILTKEVVKLAEAAGGEHRACVVFCLLVCSQYFKKLSFSDLSDADMNVLRAKACEVLTKLLIEKETNEDFLFNHVLLQKYSFLKHGERTDEVTAMEMAVDLHACFCISSSGYQRCISYIWNGFLVQDYVSTPEGDTATNYISYDEVANTNFWRHFNAERVKVPKYQHALTLIISFIFLGLYTGAVNTANPEGDVDVAEALLYFFTAGFICDELVKIYKVGFFRYVAFWNFFNMILYSLLTSSFITRCIALSKKIGSSDRVEFDVLSYRLLAFAAPLMWTRMLLYLDLAFRFFGTMLVVLKEMMKESSIFFALLMVMGLGFLQAFLGLASADGSVGITGKSLKTMLEALLQSPAFGTFDDLAPPFGMILYYAFAFVTTVILLNILVALYSSAYDSITNNAVEEYLALAAHKILNFIRAPDEHVFIAPLNLIEIFLLILPFEWWLFTSMYQRLSRGVMTLVYSPWLLLIAFYESRIVAPRVREHRKHGNSDDALVSDWGGTDVPMADWEEQVKRGVPDLEHDDFEHLQKTLENIQKELADAKSLLTSK